MGTVLSRTAWCRTLMVTLVVVVSGSVALPAATAAQSSHKQSRKASTASNSRVDGGATRTDVAVVGPAVKYVRTADGSVRRVR